MNEVKSAVKCYNKWEATKDLLKGFIIINIFYGMYFLFGVLIGISWEFIMMYWFITDIVIIYCFKKNIFGVKEG